MARTGRPLGRTPDTEEMFWKKIHVLEDKNACWLWKMAKSKSGYGKATWLNKTWRPHRLAYLFTHGKVGDLIMHSCDQRLCCNPRHLREGTVKENMVDAAIKGRTHKPKGELHPMSKLTVEIVKEIKRKHASGIHFKELATEYSVSGTCITDVINKRRWAHVK